MRIWQCIGLSALRRERGQDMAEYALIIALIAIVAVLAVTYLGRTIADTLYNGFSANIIAALH